MAEKTKTVNALDVKLGDEFRIGGWKASVIGVTIVNDYEIKIEFSVGGSTMQSGEFYTLVDGPFTILEKEPK